MTFRAFFRDLGRATFHRPTANELHAQWEITQAHREAEAARAEAKTLRAHLDKLREPTAVDLIAAQTRIDQAATELHNVTEGGPNRWRMSIPALPDYDTDRIIGAGLEEGDRLVREVSHLRDLVAEIIGQFHQTGHPGEPCRRTGWISEKQVTAWRVAAGPTTYVRGGVITTTNAGEPR